MSLIITDRLNQNHQEDIDRLLQSMEFNLHLSKNEQSLLLEKVDDVDYLVNLMHTHF